MLIVGLSGLIACGDDGGSESSNNGSKTEVGYQTNPNDYGEECRTFEDVELGEVNVTASGDSVDEAVSLSVASFTPCYEGLAACPAETAEGIYEEQEWVSVSFPPDDSEFAVPATVGLYLDDTLLAEKQLQDKDPLILEPADGARWRTGDYEVRVQGTGEFNLKVTAMKTDLYIEADCLEGQ